MVTHMKTTIEISDPLIERAKRLAAKEDTTLRELVEAGLRKVLDGKRTHKPFQLRDARVFGQGLQPDFQSASWDQTRDAVYAGRGT